MSDRRSRRHPGCVTQGWLALATLLLAASPSAAQECLRSFPATGSPGGVVAGDLDGDTRPDLVVSIPGEGRLQVLLSDASGGWAPAQSIVTGGIPRGMIAADFDEDGRLDLAVTNSALTDVSIRLGRGDGTFGDPASHYVPGDPRSVDSGDFNADGILDLAVVSPIQSRVFILRGTGTGGVGDGGFLSPSYFPTGSTTNRPSVVRAGDLDLDGALDLVFAFPQTNRGGYMFGAKTAGVANGSFESLILQPMGDGTSDVHVADTDGDRLQDITAASPGSSYVYRTNFRPDRTIANTGVFNLDIPASMLTTADFDGDGKLDLAAASASAVHFVFSLGVRETWTGQAGLSGLAPLPSAGASARLVLTSSTGGTAIVVDPASCFTLPEPPPPPTPGPPPLPAPAPPGETLGIAANGCWGSEAPAVVPAAVVPEGLTLAADGVGGAYLTWRDRRNVAAGEIFATRIGPDGEPIAPWPAEGRTIRPPATGSPTAAPLPDGAGGLILVIGEDHSGSTQFWAHHLLPDGTPAPDWPAGGLRIDAPDFTPFRFVADGSEGLLVVGRSPAASPPASWDLRVRRWNSAGVAPARWPAAGVTFTSYSTASISFGSAVGDDYGGVYLSWDSYIPPCSGHGCGSGSWGDHFAYVRDGQVKWTGSSFDALGFASLQSDSRGNAFGYYTTSGTAARCVLWTPAGNLWNVPSPIHLWALRAAVGDGSGGALFLGESGDTYRLYRIGSDGVTPSPWPPAGVPLLTVANDSPAGMLPDLLGGALVLANRRSADASWSLTAQYVSNLGLPAPSWPTEGTSLDAGPSPIETIGATPDGLGGYLVFWIDPNGGTPVIRGQKLCRDAPVPVTLAFDGHEFREGALHMRWTAPAGSGGTATVDRRGGPEQAWSLRGPATFDPSGFYTFVDDAVRPGEAHEYRLAVEQRGTTVLSDPVRVTIPFPGTSLAVDVGRQPVRRGDFVEFSLRSAGEARFEIFDTRGRRKWHESLNGLGAGSHRRTLPDLGPGGPGVYWLRLTQGGESALARLIVLD